MAFKDFLKSFTSRTAFFISLNIVNNCICPFFAIYLQWLGVSVLQMAFIRAGQIGASVLGFTVGKYFMRKMWRFSLKKMLIVMSIVMTVLCYLCMILLSNPNIQYKYMQHKDKAAYFEEGGLYRKKGSVETNSPNFTISNKILTVPPFYKNGEFSNNNFISESEIVINNPTESRTDIGNETAYHKSVQSDISWANENLTQTPQVFENDKSHYVNGKLYNGVHYSTEKSPSVTRDDLNPEFEKSSLNIDFYSDKVTTENIWNLFEVPKNTNNDNDKNEVNLPTIQLPLGNIGTEEVDEYNNNGDQEDEEEEDLDEVIGNNYNSNLDTETPEDSEDLATSPSTHILYFENNKIYNPDFQNNPSSFKKGDFTRHGVQQTTNMPPNKLVDFSSSHPNSEVNSNKISNHKSYNHNNKFTKDALLESENMLQYINYMKRHQNISKNKGKMNLQSKSNVETALDEENDKETFFKTYSDKHNADFSKQSQKTLDSSGENSDGRNFNHRRKYKQSLHHNKKPKLENVGIHERKALNSEKISSDDIEENYNYISNFHSRKLLNTFENGLQDFHINQNGIIPEEVDDKFNHMVSMMWSKFFLSTFFAILSEALLAFVLSSTKILWHASDSDSDVYHIKLWKIIIWAMLVCPPLAAITITMYQLRELVTHFWLAIFFLVLASLLVICMLSSKVNKKTKRLGTDFLLESECTFIEMNQGRCTIPVLAAGAGIITACNSEFMFWYMMSRSTNIITFEAFCYVYVIVMTLSKTPVNWFLRYKDMLEKSDVEMGRDVCNNKDKLSKMTILFPLGHFFLGMHMLIMYCTSSNFTVIYLAVLCGSSSVLLECVISKYWFSFGYILGCLGGGLVSFLKDIPFLFLISGVGSLIWSIFIFLFLCLPSYRRSNSYDRLPSEERSDKESLKLLSDSENGDWLAKAEEEEEQRNK